MLIRETWVNKTEGYITGNTELYKPFTDDIKELLQTLRKEYGECISKIFVDPDAKQIGWVFEKKVKYDDCNETFLMQTGVELHEKKPDHTVENHYFYLN